MLLLGEISTFGLLAIVGIAAWLMLRPTQGRACAHRGGFWKVLGIVAVVAGLSVFWSRSERSHVVHVDAPVVVDSDMPELDELLVDPPHLWKGFGHHESIHVRPDRWVFILLGSAVVILGALVFNRGCTRGRTVKALTFLGVGAIIYCVTTYAGRLPRASTAPDASHLVRLDSERGERKFTHRHHNERRPRAKRPALRPERPDSESRDEEMPPRAGGIPVAAELAKDDKPRDAAPESPAEPAAPAPPEEPAPAQSPAPDVAPPEPAPQEPNTPATTETASAARQDAASKPVEPAPQSPHTAEADAAAKAPKPALETDQPRPDWVDAADGLAPGGVYTMTVHSGRFTSVPECQRALEHEIKKAADHYIDVYLDPGAAEVVNLPISYLNQHVKKAEYADMKHSQAIGQPMYEIHARLEFDNRVRADLHRQRRNAEVIERLWYTGGGAALVLALLGTFYGYLKLDLRSGGKNSGRLQLAATLVALIAVAGVLLVRFAVTF